MASFTDVVLQHWQTGINDCRWCRALSCLYLETWTSQNDLCSAYHCFSQHCSCVCSSRSPFELGCFHTKSVHSLSMSAWGCCHWRAYWLDGLPRSGLIRATRRCLLQVSFPYGVVPNTRHAVCYRGKFLIYTFVDISEPHNHSGRSYSSHSQCSAPPIPCLPPTCPPSSLYTMFSPFNRPTLYPPL